MWWQLGLTAAAFALQKLVENVENHDDDDDDEQEVITPEDRRERPIHLSCLNDNSIREVIDKTHPEKRIGDTTKLLMKLLNFFNQT
jgi:hypothetical protein